MLRLLDRFFERLLWWTVDTVVFCFLGVFRLLNRLFPLVPPDEY